MMMKMVATCLLGIEGIVADDLKAMDAQNVCAENGSRMGITNQNPGSLINRSFQGLFMPIWCEITFQQKSLQRLIFAKAFSNC